MAIAISVKNLIKRFQIYDSPRDRLREAFRFFRKTPYFSEVTALRDVTFEIQKGRFVGIVGSNGAGKSTLLKMLSGELTPTSGSIEMNGKVALLQLGVGFNAQLTGRENAMFAANLLGYSDKELSRLIQEVETFAEIGAFFDHPVRTYSSGMYSRLAFAVAVTVDPDILIADEVLAVGDMSFSQRCLRKMRDFKDRGKTVLLVSHDLPTINAFCDEVLWIKDSTIFMQGETARITEHFKNFMYYGKLPPKENEDARAQKRNEASMPSEELSWVEIGQRNDVIGEGGMRGTRTALSINAGPGTKNAVPGDKIELSIEFVVEEDINPFSFGFVLVDRHGQVFLHSNNEIAGQNFAGLSKGQRGKTSLWFRLPAIAPGVYGFNIAFQESVGELKVLWRAHAVHELAVTKSPRFEGQCGLVLIEEQGTALSLQKLQ